MWVHIDAKQRSANLTHQRYRQQFSLPLPAWLYRSYDLLTLHQNEHLGQTWPSHDTFFVNKKTEIKLFDRFDNKLHRVLRSFAYMYAKFASHGLCQFKHITSYLSNIKTKSIQFETKPYHNRAALRSVHPRGMLPTLCISHTLPSDNTFLICKYITSGTLSTN